MISKGLERSSGQPATSFAFLEELAELPKTLPVTQINSGSDTETPEKDLFSLIRELLEVSDSKSPIKRIVKAIVTSDSGMWTPYKKRYSDPIGRYPGCWEIGYQRAFQITGTKTIFVINVHTFSSDGHFPEWRLSVREGEKFDQLTHGIFTDFLSDVNFRQLNNFWHKVNQSTCPGVIL